MISMIVPNMFFGHLEQLLFSKLCCILLLSWSRTQGSLCSSWSCGGQGRMSMTSMMVPNMFFCHLEQLLFSKHCSEKLYFEIAVKFSSQEHTRPPRIQEEKKIFDSRFSKSGLGLTRKQLPEQYLTSEKLREWPQTWPFYPLLEGEIIKIRNFGTTMVHQILGKNFYCPAIRGILATISNCPYRDTHGTPKMVDK